MGSGVGGCSVGRTFPVLPQHVPSWAAWSLEPLSLPAWSWGALLLLSCLLLREVSPHFLNHREPRQGPLAGHMFRLAAAVPSRSSVSLAHLRRGGEEARVLLPQSSFHLSFCPQGGFLLCFLVAALQWTLTSRVPGGRVGLPQALWQLREAHTFDFLSRRGPLSSLATWLRDSTSLHLGQSQRGNGKEATRRPSRCCRPGVPPHPWPSRLCLPPVPHGGSPVSNFVSNF